MPAYGILSGDHRRSLKVSGLSGALQFMQLPGCAAAASGVRSPQLRGISAAGSRRSSWLKTDRSPAAYVRRADAGQRVPIVVLKLRTGPGAVVGASGAFQIPAVPFQ